MSEPELPPGLNPDDLKLYRTLIARCWIVAGLLVELPLEALESLAARAEQVGPALYPDIWRANALAIMEDREVVRALVTAQRDILTTSPSLANLAPIIRDQADAHRAALDAVFRDVLTRREVAKIPPAIILTALVRLIARSVPPKGS